MNKKTTIILNDPMIGSVIKSINDFFDSIGPAESIENTSQLVSTFLEKTLKEDSDYDQRFIKKVVWTENFKNEFITRIFESWTQFKNQHGIDAV